jgi:hypothetical protein
MHGVPHYHAQGYLIAATSLNQVSVSTRLHLAGRHLPAHLRMVTLPIIAPAIASIAVFFVRSIGDAIGADLPQRQKRKSRPCRSSCSTNPATVNQRRAYSVRIMVVVGGRA